MTATPNPYLRTKVLTASPEQLRLMLLEGAVKFCRQGRHALTTRNFEGMYDALTRAQRIVLELSNALNHKVNAELCERLAALYTYIYKRLVDTNIERDISALDEAIKLLDYERETWVMAIRKLTGSDADADADSEAVPAAPTAPALAADEAAAHDLPNPIATIGPASPAAASTPSPAKPVNPFAKPAAAARTSFSIQG
jgi:flagellar protein FliS